MIVVTLSTLFLNHLMEQICTLYALNFFIVETVWLRNMFKDGKCILVASTESLESQCKTFLKTLWFFNDNQFPNFIDFLLGLIDQITDRKRECSTFRPGNRYYLILFDILFFNILSWVLLLNECLERRSPHNIAKLDGHITFVSFWRNFFMPLSWLFLYGIFVIRAYYVFLWYKITLHCYGHRVRFFATMRGIQCSNFI